jgi:hypothetical protein
MERTEVDTEIAEAEGHMDARALRFWRKICVPPQRWSQVQYPKVAPFWVVAVLGRQCLCFNELEKGWGWGEFREWGRIEEYHCQQDEIHHAVFQTLFAIDGG